MAKKAVEGAAKKVSSKKRARVEYTTADVRELPRGSLESEDACK